MEDRSPETFGFSAEAAKVLFKKAVEEETAPQQEETETEQSDNFEISDIYVEEENPDGIIDKLFHTVAEENNQPQEEKENEHKVDPDEFALYKKYLG